jgi:hypothetical protein
MFFISEQGLNDPMKDGRWDHVEGGDIRQLVSTLSFFSAAKFV